MKSYQIRKFLAPGLMTLALVLTTASLAAQQEDSPAPVAPSKASLKKYDANKDGQLDEAETAQMKADAKARHDAQQAEDLAKYDADHDGKLSKEERAAMKADKTAQKEAAREAKQAAKEAAKGDAW